MAEEITQEERVKIHQVSIAKSMKVNKDVLDILQSIKEWHIREWLYVCGLDGMPADQIRTLAEENASVTKIKNVRKEFLKNLWGDMGKLEREVKQMREEVTSVCTASKAARSVIESGLEEALRKQSIAQEATIKTQEQMIQMLQKQISSMRKNQKADSEKVPVPDRLEKNPANETKKGIFDRIICSMDTKRFIRNYIQNDQYSPEQKEYFLKCLEEGMAVKKIEEIASPGLSVEVMQRLRELKGSGSKGDENV